MSFSASRTHESLRSGQFLLRYEWKGNEQITLKLKEKITRNKNKNIIKMSKNEDSQL